MKIKKLLFAVPVVLLALLLSSCGGKNNPVNETPEKLIIGTWDLIALKEKTDSEWIELTGDSKRDEGMILMFGSDQKGSLSEYNSRKDAMEKRDFTYKIDGKLLYLDGTTDGRQTSEKVTIVRLDGEILEFQSGDSFVRFKKVR